MAAIAAAEANTAVARRRGANGTTFSRSARAVERIRSAQSVGRIGRGRTVGERAGGLLEGGELGLAVGALRQVRLVGGHVALVERVQRVGGGQLVDGVSLHRSSSGMVSSSKSRRRARPVNTRLLIVPSGTPSRSDKLRLREARVERELDRLALRVGQLCERLAHARALECLPGCLGDRVVCRRLGRVLERLGRAPLLAANRVDGAAMDEHEDPGARLGSLGHEAPGGSPDGEEGLLHRVLGQVPVAENAQREPEGDAAVTVVELRQRVLVRARDERHERLVGKVCVLPARSHGVSRPGRAAQR